MSDDGEPAAVRFEVLGPLRAWRGDAELDLGPVQRRVVLAVLVLNANKPVGREQLIAAVWGPAAPNYAVNLVQKHVSGLRGVLDPARPARAPSPVLAWTEAGYLLRIPAGLLDLDVYQREVSRARAARAVGDLPAAAQVLHGALRLWRGPVCDGLASPFLEAERDRLGEGRITAVEDCLELDVSLGGHRDLVAELQHLVAGHPMRERLRGLLMLALYRSGRQAEALAVYQDTRRCLRDELGVDPTAQLQRLHQQILAAGPAVAAPAAAGSVTAGGIEAGRGLRSAAAAAGRGVFVGRAGELAGLAAAAAAARRGQPRVVLVEGDAGIGKSALLARFASGLASAMVLRASGDEAELQLPYGVEGQQVASARGAGGGPPGLLAAELSDGVDPLAVGADLVAWLGQFRGLVLAVIDDLHWADGPSARALLFAVRRLQADQVLVVVSARTGELARLGEGWQRFLAGDHRAGRVRLGGLGPEDVVALGRAVGVGELSRRAAGRLLDYTGGNPLYCRAVLEEAGIEGLDRPGGPLRVPRSLAGVVLLRVAALSPAGRELVVAAAVLGSRCGLAAAAGLAGLGDPRPALGEAVAAGILVEQPDGPAAGIGFSHLLVQRAVYGDLSPVRRGRLHQQAAGLVGRDAALGHRVAAAIGPDDKLAGELEAAGREALALDRTAQAAAWLAQAAASSEPEAADRRLLDALEILVTYGQVAEAEILAARVPAGPDARRGVLLGTLDLLAGRAAAAEARLRAAWQAHDRARDAPVGAAAATQLAVLCLTAGRITPAIEWGERAAQADGVPAALLHEALGVLAIALFADGRGAEGLARLAFLPAAPSEVSRQDTDALVLRGMARVAAEDLAGAIADLSTAAARLRAGVPLRYASQCLSWLAGAEYRLGSWDDAVMHSELAVSLAHDADRVWDFGFVHSFAAVVPAARGDWEVASAHVRIATEAAQAFGAAGAVTAASTARAFLASARGDLEGVADAAAALRATGRAELLSLLGHCDWRSLEIDALIGLGRLDQAETALAELETALSPDGPPSALVAAARLRGDLATAAGHPGAAAEAFETAWRHAQGLRAPLALAQLEISHARHLRAAGQKRTAVALLRSARQRLLTLGARPYLQACDRDLAAAAPAEPETAPVLSGLTPAEQAVARLVATGRSNRQTAAELYISVKTVEFHLGHIFAKLGIRSRHDLITRIGAPARPDGNQGRT